MKSDRKTDSGIKYKTKLNPPKHNKLTVAGLAPNHSIQSGQNKLQTFLDLLYNHSGEIVQMWSCKCKCITVILRIQSYPSN